MHGCQATPSQANTPIGGDLQTARRARARPDPLKGGERAPRPPSSQAARASRRPARAAARQREAAAVVAGRSSRPARGRHEQRPARTVTYRSEKKNTTYNNTSKQKNVTKKCNICDGHTSTTELSYMFCLRLYFLLAAQVQQKDPKIQ